MPIGVWSIVTMLLHFIKLVLKKYIWIQSFFFKKIYSVFYRKNIHCNNYVLVQQEWLRKEFCEAFSLNNVVVAHPDLDADKFVNSIVQSKTYHDKYIFVYPAYPRVFKNFEVICEAAHTLYNSGVLNFEIWLTIDGNENRYSRYIKNKYHKIPNIKFKGLQTRERVFEMYSQSDALLFPSKLETWGLPITEFKAFSKPMLVVDLPYAHETVGQYKHVSFFQQSDSVELSKQMEQLIRGNSILQGHSETKIKEPYVKSWEEMFEYILR